MSIDLTLTYRAELPLAQRINVAYFNLAYQCVLPAVEALDAGKHDIEALLAVAFSPVMHSLLACIAPTNAWCVLPLLQRLIRPAHQAAITRFENPRNTALFLETHRNRKQLVLFDLRLGGGVEFDEYQYVPLYDRQGQMGTFSAEALPLVVAVLNGWGATMLVIHPQPTERLPLATLQAQVEAQWERLTRL